MNLPISFEDQFLAFIGSFGYVLVLVLAYINKRNSGKVRIKQNEYLNKNWLPFLIIILLGQILCIAKEYLVVMYVTFLGEPKHWQTYVKIEGGLSFLIGVFGVGIFDKIFKIGNNYLKSND